MGQGDGGQLIDAGLRRPGQMYAYSNPTIYIDLNGNLAVLSDVSTFLKGVVKDSKARINDMNTEVQKGYGGFWEDFGTRTVAAGMGIANAALTTAAVAVDITDFSADAQIAMMPLAGLTETGREAQAHMSRAADTAVNVAEAGMQLAARTAEDPTGTAKELVTVAVEGGGDYLHKTFIEGDLNYTADFSGKMVEMVADVATGGAGALTKMSVKQVV
ncbi:MAG: hypothetical protein GY862_34775, partial [Gammaproteobacteria bacterium]|nr:hypothetical protein [Gammaproteobacteria bacterium]